MAKPPSQRELVATLLALAEDDTDAQELDEFLGIHSSRLELALQTPAPELLALATRAPAARAKRLHELVRQAKDREQTAHASAAQNFSLAAATMLAMSAVWSEGGARLDSRIVLGRNLVADRTRKFVRFDLEGSTPITIAREKLVESAKALKFSDVTCSVDRHGLRFGWRSGKGGLLLVSQCVDARHRDAMLTVAIAKPRLEPAPTFQLRPRQRVSRWFGEVFGDLTSL